MVLTAGAGSRLRPLTDRVPKPMIAIAGRPLVEHTIERLAHSGIKDIVMNLHHLPSVITSHFGDGRRWGVRIHYSHEPELLGTAGALRPAARHFRDTFLVIYGDNLSTCDFGRLIAHHRARGAFTTVALIRRDDPQHSGVAELDADDRIVRFVEKPRAGETDSRWVNTGILVLEPGAVETIPSSGSADLGRDLLPMWIREGKQVVGYRMSDRERLWWIDTPEELTWVEREMATVARDVSL